MKQSSRRMRATRTQSTLFFPTTPDISDTVPKYTGKSKVHGKVNTEVEEYVKQKLIAALFKFRFDR